MEHPRISIDPAVMGGKPCIKGTRVLVEILLDHLSAGETIEQLLEGFPFIAREDIQAAIAYAADFLRQDGVVPA